MMYDITIIGAGITGSLIAYYLSKYDLSVLLLEKENDVSQAATGANSAMIHSGHDPKDKTLKCKYNLLGNAMYPKLCEDLKVSYKAIGAFVVATCSEEEEKLDVLVRQCIDRNVPYEILDGDKARDLEPNLSDDVCKVLSLPTTGIVSPWEVTIASMEEALLNGVELRLNYEVSKIDKKDDCFLINDDIKSKVLINCAGVHCDDVTNLLRVSPYKVEARKGEYYVLDHLNDDFVGRVIYPVPTNKGKGVLAIPTIHGNTLLGPNSDYIEDKNDTSTDKGLDFVKKEINKTVKNVPFNKMIHTFAGLRPHIDLDDFYIQEDDQIDSFIHVVGIESPGISAAPAIAKDVVENIVLKKFECHKKQNYIHRKAYIKMNDLSDKQKDELIKKNPDFGKIVCRCENISKGEIIDVINRKCGARTIKGVKLRCRPGMGRCQGGFCEPEVVRILAEQLNLDLEDIEFNKKGSNILAMYCKEGL